MNQLLVMEFARKAETYGWNISVLNQFCHDRKILREQQKKLWPHGVRSVADQLNSIADAELMSAFSSKKARQMSEIFHVRFSQNFHLKKAVVRLALSDSVHPRDTIIRTYRTIKVMRQCHDAGEAKGVVRNGILLMTYSLCVLLWFADFTSNQRITRRVGRVLLKITGEG